jgi:hypothetical protein
MEALNKMMNLEVQKFVSQTSSGAVTLETLTPNQKIVARRLELFQNVIDRLLKSEDYEEVSNICYILNDLSVRNEDIKDYATVFFQTYSQKNLEAIFTKFYSGEDDLVRLYVGECINNILKFMIDLNGGGDLKDSELVSSFWDKSLTPALVQLVDLLAKIIHNHSRKEVVSTSGVLVPAAGLKLKKAVEILIKVLNLEIKKVLEAAEQKGLFGAILSVFIDYPWSNIMLGHIEKFLYNFLSAFETEQTPLLAKYFKPEMLVSFLARFNQTDNGGKLVGNKGYMINLGNLMMNKFTKANGYQSVLQSNFSFSHFISLK